MGSLPNAPFHTYGPSEDIFTHTPITFNDLGQGKEGLYNNPNFLTTLQNIPLILQRIASPYAGRIMINPNSDDVNRIIKHEATHSLLIGGLGSSVARQIASSIPGYSQIASKLAKSHPNENMQDEVPAYMAAFSPTEAPGIPQQVRDAYAHALQGKLMQSNPVAGKKFSKIADLTDYFTKATAFNSGAATIPQSEVSK